MSPVLGSVTAASPSCNPVRREVFSHLGECLDDVLDMRDDAIGFLQRTARGHDVIKNETAFVHSRKQVASQCVEADIRNCDQDHAEATEPDRMFQRAAQPASRRTR